MERLCLETCISHFISQADKNEVNISVREAVHVSEACQLLPNAKFGSYIKLASTTSVAPWFVQTSETQNFPLQYPKQAKRFTKLSHFLHQKFHYT